MDGRTGHWRGTPTGAGPLLLAALLCGGCTTPGQRNPFSGSLGELFEPLFAKTPGQLARDAFDYADADKRRRAILYLSAAPWGGEGPYLRTYRLAARTDRNETVRAAALSALGRHGQPEDVPLIASGLAEKAPILRLEAAIALQRVHHADAVAPLLAAVTRDTDADVRMAAARALGQYPQPAVFDALVGALNDHHYGVVRSAHWSLTTLTGEDLNMASGPWLDWGRAHADHLFDGRRPYLWQPYEKPRGFCAKAQFWKRHHPVPPRPPTGLEAPAQAS